MSKQPEHFEFETEDPRGNTTHREVMLALDSALVSNTIPFEDYLTILNYVVDFEAALSQFNSSGQSA